ncbi:MAG: sulfoacetaldehyde dehydrogenase [Betaproteobacteria bacterium RIFCSPLOWO2_12_FULL_65_14]|nr:MAG: sulfoacetaldehyde dehydrogenase [Betaproteobacteria bacterium RIFCSPLOWO2_12_FULL_65_14]
MKHENPERAAIASLVARARAAQARYERYSQERIDEVATACGWAIMKPENNRALAELAVRDTGLGDVADKVAKNHRKTLGLLRDIQGVRTVGVIAEYPERGITEIARPVGVVAAITPSTNPGATPANQIINALKCGNAIVLAPSPKGYSTCAKLLDFIHAEFRKIGADPDLVQLLPAPVTKEDTHELMRQADLVAATGSQSNIRAAYSSGRPAIGVGQGNVVSIVDASADLADAAAKIARSKTFDNATSCSSENAVVILAPVYEAMLAQLAAQGGVLLDAGDKAKLQAVMFPGGKLSPATTAQSATRIAGLASLKIDARFLMVEETGTGPAHPFSGEKLAPVLAVYRAADFDAAFALTRRIYDYQGKGHSVSIHTRDDTQAMRLGLEMPVARVIVNQAHCIATGGSFDNGLPFSLSMGCGTWGGNSFSDNMHWRHFLNITRIARVIPEKLPAEDQIFGAYHARHGG